MARYDRRVILFYMDAIKRHNSHEWANMQKPDEPNFVAYKSGAHVLKYAENIFRCARQWHGTPVCVHV